MQEDLFGRVVATQQGERFSNNTEYGLTGVVITTNLVHIEHGKGDFHIENLYFNRNCTSGMLDMFEESSSDLSLLKCTLCKGKF